MASAPHVFISYSRKDSAFVDKLEGDLNQRGLLTWRDRHSIVGGEAWFLSIQQGIQNAYVVVAVHTVDAEQSKWCRRELIYADQLNVPVIPVFPKAYAHPLPIYLVEIQPVGCEETQYESGLAQLVAALEKQPRTTYLMRAPHSPAAAPAPAAASPSLRDKELLYLDFLLGELKAEQRTAHYVNLMATPERVRAAKKSGRFDDPELDFSLLGMEKISGEAFDRAGEPVADAREEVLRMGRSVLLGEPGAGKTTTLYQVAIDIAQRAKADATAPLPVFVPLKSYSGDVPFEDFVRGEMGALQNEYAALRQADRLFFLCDALNEMARRAADGRPLLDEVRAFLQDKARWVVSCRERDYHEELSAIDTPGKIRLLPLTLPQIYDMVTRYAEKPEDGAALWAALEGKAALLEAWRAFEGSGQDFWQARWRFPAAVKAQFEDDEARRHAQEAWREMHNDRRRMMQLCRNPFMLFMVRGVFKQLGKVPENRGRLFAQFVANLLKREERASHATGAAWIEEKTIRAALARLAFAMQESETGTEITHAAALQEIRGAFAAEDAELLLRLGSAASLLQVGDTVAFTHQLLHQYFASEVMGSVMDAAEPATPFFPPARWWEAGVWRETAVILAGVRGDPEGVARWLAPYQIEVAWLALTESGVTVEPARLDEKTRAALIAGAQDKQGENNPVGRAAAYRVMGYLNGDSRPGVGVRADGLPDFEWVKVEGGGYALGGDKEAGYSLPEMEEEIEAFEMARYPVTYAQYEPFVEGEGYNNPAYWTAAGWAWREKGNITEPDYWQDAQWHVANHPVVGVSWYEAYAYGQWASAALGEKIRLPREVEWEATARGKKRRTYAYAGKFDPLKCNTRETGIGRPSAVGIFPFGATPEGGIEDMSGNVWEWTQTAYEEGRMGNDDSNSINERVLRGGSFGNGPRYTRAAIRLKDYPDSRNSDGGFRVVRGRS